VAPYGEVAWVRNARAAGSVELRRADRREAYGIEPAADAEARDILVDYLELEPITRPFFAAGTDASGQRFQYDSVAHPVLRLQPVGPMVPLGSAEKGSDGTSSQ